MCKTAFTASALAALRHEIKAQMSPYRFAHTAGVQDMASTPARMAVSMWANTRMVTLMAMAVTRCPVVSSMMVIGNRTDVTDRVPAVGPMAMCMRANGLMTFPMERVR